MNWPWGGVTAESRDGSDAGTDSRAADTADAGPPGSGRGTDATEAEADVTFSRRSVLSLAAGALGAASNRPDALGGTTVSGGTAAAGVVGFGYGGTPITADSRNATVTTTSTGPGGGTANATAGASTPAAPNGTTTPRGTVTSTATPTPAEPGSSPAGGATNTSSTPDTPTATPTRTPSADRTATPTRTRRATPADAGGATHGLVVEGAGPKATYEFSVSGEVTGGGDLTGSDSYSGSSASGAVGEWSDAYTFTGDLESVSVAGDATVRLDGERIDPDEYGAGGSDGGAASGHGSDDSDDYGVIGYGEGGYGGTL